MEVEKKPGKIIRVLIENDGEFLVVKNKAVDGRSEWGFPEDGQGADEDDLKAAVRISREKTEVKVIANEKLFEQNNKETQTKISYVYATPTGERETKENEQSSEATVEWVPAEELLTRFTTEVHPLIKNFILAHVRAAEEED